MYVSTVIDFSIWMNLEISQQQSCIQFKLRADKMTPDVNSSISPDQSALSYRCSARLLHGCMQCCRRKSRLRRSTGMRIVLLEIKGDVRKVSQSSWLRERVSDATDRGGDDVLIEILDRTSALAPAGRQPLLLLLCTGRDGGVL